MPFMLLLRWLIPGIPVTPKLASILQVREEHGKDRPQSGVSCTYPILRGVIFWYNHPCFRPVLPVCLV
jgi:hypothetical protein